MSVNKTRETKFAEVEVSGNKAPILTPGMLTPEVLHHFENSCKSYLRNKKIEAADQVSAIAGNMHDPLISNWYWMDEARINQLTFDAFVMEVHNKWLAKGWEKDVHRRILSTKQDGEPFWEWAVQMRNLNAIIHGLTDHLMDKELRNQLEANSDKDLVIACDKDKVNEIVKLDDWLAATKNTNEQVRREREQARVNAEEAVRLSFKKRSASAAGFQDGWRSNPNAPFSAKNENGSKGEHSVKTWSGRSGNKAEVERDYKDDEKDEVEGSERIRNEKRT
jgi:hypothetical protein